MNIPLEEIKFINNPDQPDDLGDGKGNTNGIEHVNTDVKANDGYYYDLQGNRYGTTTDGLRRGVYIHNGKKVIVK